MKLATGAALLSSVLSSCAREPPPPPRLPGEPLVTAPAPGAARCELAERGPDGATRLERALLDALRGARFDEVVDLGPDAGGAHPTRCERSGRCEAVRPLPHVDVALAVFAPGCPPALANAMLSPASPGGRVNRLDPVTLALRGVRLRPWTPEGDGLPDPVGEPAADFAVPYPASNFKLLVAVEVLAQVDGGRLRLDEPLVHGGRSRALRAWLEDMLTWSDDASTAALLRRLHALGEAERVNARLARLGLTGLSLRGTSAETGRGWHPGRIHMTAWDTVRLLWLLDPSAPPPAWIAPDGLPVDAAFLSPGAKAHLVGLLEQQAFHDALSAGALCGREETSPGIPALLPARWIGDDGAVLLLGGRDARPCNERAEVTFAHKTGLTLHFGSDAGLVRGLPGRATRHYLVAFFSSLGHRYTDADKVGDAACFARGICYTQRVPRLGAALDAAIARAVEPAANGP